jgi:hypothetical protein
VAVRIRRLNCGEWSRVLAFEGIKLPKLYPLVVAILIKIR